MKTRLNTLLSLLILVSILVSGCSSGNIPFIGGKTVTVTIVYGSEKKDWLEPLVAQYNQDKHKTPDGATIMVEAQPMGSIESVNAILQGHIQPTVWSPASSVYIPVANAEWRKSNASDLVDGTQKDLVLSPVVIAMWEPMARALGWPGRALGWGDIAKMAISENGWADYGYPEWGKFKFGHTHPNYSNSGLVAVIAEAYAGAGKQRDLTQGDLDNPATQEFMSQVEKAVIHYGTSTGFFAERMFERGPSYLSAAVLYENLVVAQESKRLAGSSQQLPVVAIYPKEGTFWSNHPYIILNAPWVNAEQKAAAQDFQSFLLDRPQQVKAIELGFRPSDTAIPLSTPLDAQHGVDPAQPMTVLEIPPAPVIAGVTEIWKTVKKPVDLIVIMDVSGSMKGDKIAAARASLRQFIQMLDDRDRLQVMVFNEQVTSLGDLSLLGENRQKLDTRVAGITEVGGTALYDATLQAYQAMEENGDPDHIRAIVVLSDGLDTKSVANLEDVMARINSHAEEGGASAKLFTIAFGADADQAILGQIAEATGGRVFSGDPASIAQVYAEIATFF